MKDDDKLEVILATLWGLAVAGVGLAILWALCRYGDGILVALMRGF